VANVAGFFGERSGQRRQTRFTTTAKRKGSAYDQSPTSASPCSHLLTTTPGHSGAENQGTRLRTGVWRDRKNLT